MKLIALATLALFLGGCSSAQEKHQERQEEARRDYRKSLEDNDNRYDREIIKEDKEAAKEMIDEADSVDVDGSRGTINVDE